MATRSSAPHRIRTTEPSSVGNSKYTGREPEWLGDFLRDLTLDRSSRFSKYARAVRELRVDKIAKRDSA